MKKKSNNSLIIIIVVIFCLLLGVVIFLTFKNNNIKEENKPIETIEKPIEKEEPINEDEEEDEEETNIPSEMIDIKSKYDTEKFTLGKLSRDGYGFIKVYFDDRYDVIELTTTGQKNTIMSFKSLEDNSIWNEPFHALVQNGKLYFEIVYAEDFEMDSGWKNKNSRLVEIDLNSLYTRKVYDSSTFELMYDYYAVNNSIIYKTRDSSLKLVDGIFKYDPETDTMETINNKLEASEIFIYNNRIFLKCTNKNYKGMSIKDNKKINTKKTYNYLSMDLEGKNIKAYTEKEYKEYKKKANIKTGGYNSDKDMYFMYNGKKIYIKDNKLMYGNDVLYKPNKGINVELYYTQLDGYVAIHTYKIVNQSIGEDKYYLINIDTKKVVSAKKTEVFDFHKIIYK